MIGTNVVSFTDAARSRDNVAAYISDEELRRGQTIVDADTCHVALDNCTVIMKAKTSRYCLFQGLSAAFPKQRRIAILGHKGSGKTVLIDMMLKRRSVQGGRVLVNSRLSWSVSYVQYLDARLTLRQNLMFVARVMRVDPGYLIGAALDICNFQQNQLMERTRNLPVTMRRRIGLLVYLLGDFDCHVIDGPLRGMMFGAMTERLETMLSAVTSRDYIAAVAEPRQVPGNCDLAYILYNGRLFMFEDVARAFEIYSSLPPPENPNPFAGQDDKDDGDDDNNAIDLI